MRIDLPKITGPSAGGPQQLPLRARSGRPRRLVLPLVAGTAYALG
jgi:hypothetical protein